MKQRCDKQHRMGETCGRKLVHGDYVTDSLEKCRFCKDIATKERKLEKEKQNIARWRKEGKTFQSSIEKAENEIEHLNEAIRDLEKRRPKNIAGLSQGHPTGPPPNKTCKKECPVMNNNRTDRSQWSCPGQQTPEIGMSSR